MEVNLCSHSAKNSWKFFPTLHKYDKAVILLTVSADKPDTAFYHQRNCLAGILKNQRNTALESSEIAQGQRKRTKTVWSLSPLDERADHKKHAAYAPSPKAHVQPPVWHTSHRSLTFRTSHMELVIFHSKPAPHPWPSPVWEERRGCSVYSTPQRFGLKSPMWGPLPSPELGKEGHLAPLM